MAGMYASNIYRIRPFHNMNYWRRNRIYGIGKHGRKVRLSTRQRTISQANPRGSSHCLDSLPCACYSQLTLQEIISLTLPYI